LEGLLLDSDYAEEEKQPCIRLFIKNENGTIVAGDQNFKPYLYVVADEPTKVMKTISKLQMEEENRTIKPESVGLTNRTFLGQEVKAIKVTFDNPKDMAPLRHVMRSIRGVKEIYEFDIQPARRYLIDSGLVPMGGISFNGDVVEKNGVKTVLLDKPPAPTKAPKIDLNIMSFDIEVYNPTGSTRPDKDPILMISLADNRGFRKVITWKDFKAGLDYVEVVPSEREMLERFVQIVEERDVDILLGYNTDLFDFPYMRERAKVLKVKLTLGRDGSEVIARKRRLATVARIRGRPHIDVYAMIDFLATIGNIRLIHYTLENVYKYFTGKDKLDIEFTEICDAWDKGGEKAKTFLKYSMSDADATLEIGLELLPMFFELARIVRQSPFDVSRMTPGQLVEWLLIAEAFRIGELVPVRPVGEEFMERAKETYVGAYVMEPEKGLHEDIVVFDFRSLYPSIIVTHNIDPSALDCKCCKPSEATSVPELSYRFCNKRQGFIPTTLERIIKERVKVKEEMKKYTRDSREYRSLDAKQWAFKIIANSFYGMLGYPRARWYCKQCAESVTSFGRNYIYKTIEMAKNSGFEVIYGDSLPYDRRVFIRDEKGDIHLMKIGEFVEEKSGKGERYETLSFDTKKKELRFMPIRRAIKHFYNERKKGRLLDMITKYGRTVVTPQHSVYAHQDRLRLVNAKDLGVGDYLVSLTSPKLPVKYMRGQIIDVAHLNLGPYTETLRAYKDKRRFPTDVKGECPYCGGEYALAIHVNAAHQDRKKHLSPNLEKDFCFIGGENAKTGRIPRFLKLTQELAWILGYYCAEGSASDVKTKSGRKHLLSFGSQNREHILRVKRFFNNFLGDDLRIIRHIDKRTGKPMYYYRVQRIPIVALFQYGFGAGKGSDGKQVPQMIFTAEESIRKAFLDGYLAGDGGKKEKRYATHFIHCSTKSKDLAIGVHLLLKSLDGGMTYFNKPIRHVYWKYREDKSDITTLRLQSVKSPKMEGQNYCLAEITRIEPCSLNQPYVYDLEVAGTHNFVDAEGLILVHNTDSLFCKLNGKSKKDATDFLKKVNESLPGIIELELEGFYKRGVFVTKKRYAMISEDDRMVVKGLEFVRRDWAALAKKTQEAVLEAILRDGSREKAAKIVREVTKNIFEGKVDLDDLIIYTQLTMPIEQYKAIGPHVAAAKKLRAKGVQIEPGMIIAYIEAKGTGSISERAIPVDDFKGMKYDADYYVENQVLPAVMRIMEVLGYGEDDLRFEREKQSKLGKFISG
jgi:DNA polymerase I